MSEEKNLNEEINEAADAVEEAKETIEEAAEAVTETAEEVSESVDAEEIAEAAEEVTEAASELVEEITNAVEGIGDSVEAPKKTAAPAIIGVAVVVVIALIVLGIIFGPSVFNKYNRMYVNTTNRTIAEVSDQMGMSVEEFLERFDLPKNMPANTSETAAFYSMPVSKVASMRGTDFETLKEQLQFPDTITEDTTWGEAEGETAFKYIVGEENVDAFIEEYELGDDVTGDTLFKEVRTQIDTIDRQRTLESEAAANAASNAAAVADEDPVVVDEDAVANDASAE